MFRVLHDHRNSDPSRTAVERGDSAEELLDLLPIGIVRFRMGGNGVPVCVGANRMFEIWAEQPKHGAIGLSCGDFGILAVATELADIACTALDTGKVPRSRLVWSHGNGPGAHHFSADLRTRTADGTDELVIMIRDRSAEMEAEANLKRTMLTDALTGLANRLQFSEFLEDAIAHCGERHVGVALVNIDRFKRINESFGHITGDEILASFAKRLNECVRDDDHIARLAGDEFAILLKDIRSESDTQDIVRRIRNAMEKPFSIGEGEIFATTSIGIATTHSSCAYAEDLLRDGDFALHQAKSNGVSGVAVYTARDHSRAQELFRLETDLRHALENDELSQAYQPLVDLSTGRINGFEALARWHCRDRGLVSPLDFIPVAEESGLIIPLGRWALRQACQQLASWRSANANACRLTISVNVSGVQLARDDLVDAVGAALAGSDLPGEALRIELTESAIVENPERAKQILEKLKALGCIIAMDDFGTGYSSLNYLQRLPIDILKIDKSFVSKMLENEDSQKIVTAVLSLASALGMTTVAEGIETEAQMRALTLAGCDIGQGYYFDRPLPPGEAEALLAGRD